MRSFEIWSLNKYGRFRMFVEPDSQETKGVIKVDPTATARSAIRRQRTVRYSPSARIDHPSGSHQTPRRPTQNHRATSSGLDRSTLLEDIRRRGRDTVPSIFNRSRRSRIQDLGAAAEHLSPLDSHIMHNAGGQATHRNRVEVETMQETRNRAWAELSRHEREALRDQRPTAPREDTRSAEIRLRSAHIRSPAPQPESNLVYGANISPEPVSGRIPHRSTRRAAFTPGFAPAHRLNSSDSHLAYSQRVVDIASLSNQIRNLQSLPQEREDAFELSAMLFELNNMLTQTSQDPSPDYHGSETEWIDVIRGQVERIRCGSSAILGVSHDRSSLMDEEANARHLSDRSDTSRLRHDDNDGLGDRQRSLSPEGVSWETMLTTITPDDQMPSAHSSFVSTDTSASAATSFAASASTAPSTAQDVEPCPVADNGESVSDSEDRAWVSEAPRRLSNSPSSDESLSQANYHLDRIESLSSRLRHQRSQGEFIARHRRIVEREAELQRLEMTLQRLERQLEDERDVGTSNRQRPSVPRAGRERL